MYRTLDLCSACSDGLSLTNVVAGARRRLGLLDHDGDSKGDRVHSVGNRLEPDLLASGPADREALIAGKANLVAERQLVVMDSLGSPAVLGRALHCCAAHAVTAEVERCLPVETKHQRESPVPVCAHDRAAAGSPQYWPRT